MDDSAKSAEAAKRSDAAKRVRKHRDKMKAMGLKPVTLWVPDVHSPAFKADIKRQCLRLNADPHEQEILAELEHWFDPEGWT
ncbi:MAG TPA: antitoxin MazE family protein [Rhodopseudomonas sp.]|uniref:antitoxin MazE family protein n=1 Tax=Rhodopseudomonas sp. TaxID=1078 RepID=UPI002ED77CA3